ncbi:MAG: sialate O-acetylesterase [Verrucomicrobiota bacterium]
MATTIERHCRMDKVITFFFCALLISAAAGQIPDQLPDPDGKPGASDKPVKVYVLSGQSNMVGMGDISGGFSRWGKQFLDPVVSVYPGAYSEEADYDSMEPTETLQLPEFGGVKPTLFPAGGTHVVRGFVKMPATGIYEFKPGYANTTYNIMEIDGKEVYRREVGDNPVLTGIKLEADKKLPFKVTFLTNQANGLGWVGRTDIPGTLHTLVKQDGKFPHLIDDHGAWTKRNDVIYKGVISAVGQGPLTVGIQGGTIGPELQFGHVLGHYHDEPVLIIKASIGNRSLGWDILPPGSEQFTYEGRTYAGYKDTPDSWIEGKPKKEVNWYAGKQYDEYTKAIHDVLNNFDTLFPEFAGQGFEIAGFAWWQGHKDGNDAHANRYEQNLVKLIQSWRAEFEAPDAKFVIATIGFGGWELEGPHLKVAEAQLAVSGERGKYPEFKGNVLTVETRDFWREVDVSPKNQGYHYHRNAETYMLVGDALGRGMVKLLSETKE